MGVKQKLPEETESSLEIQKYKISCRAWGEAVIYSKFTSSNKFLKEQFFPLQLLFTVLMTKRNQRLRSQP